MPIKTRHNLSRLDIAKLINKKFSLSIKYSERLINDIFNLITDEAIKFRKVKVKDFGVFKLSKKNSREGRNPKTSEYYEIKSRNILNFKTSKKLNNKLNK